MEVLFATSNQHKVLEARKIGRLYGIEFRQLKSPYPEIRSDSVADVACEGARFVYSKIKKPVIVEDSGLFINALNGFPGTYSRFVFDRIGFEGILDLMAGKHDRSAFFGSAVGYCNGKCCRTFEGTVKGTIAKSASGSSGFGYDPVFVPKGFKKTFAQDSKLKERISHRTRAFELFCNFIKSKKH
jgi:XTP/dITP diphosphohydrolase